MDIDPEKLGAALRELRELRGLTQQEVADQLGKTVNYISLLENGHRGISIGLLNALCKLLRVPPAFATFLATKPSGRGAQQKLMKQIQKLIRSVLETQSRQAQPH